jgi:hypothetical protein
MNQNRSMSVIRFNAMQFQLYHAMNQNRSMSVIRFNFSYIMPWIKIGQCRSSTRQRSLKFCDAFTSSAEKQERKRWSAKRQNGIPTDSKNLQGLGFFVPWRLILCICIIIHGSARGTGRKIIDERRERTKIEKTPTVIVSNAVDLL